jgi:Zn-dependent protease
MIIASFLVAIVIHEWGHALMATLLGDPTPRNEGRLSLSLRAQLDPIGTVLAIILAFFPVAAGPVGLGWGKPVKSDAWKLRGGPNVGTFLVALGGPLASLIVGGLFAFVLRFLLLASFAPNFFIEHLLQLILVFATVNICLAIFNLIPLYPLDGYQIVYTLLPSRQAVQFARSAPYGPFIILAIIFLLPFLGQLSGLGGLFIFHIPYYILLGALNIIGLVIGAPIDFLLLLYIQR